MPPRPQQGRFFDPRTAGRVREMQLEQASAKALIEKIHDPKEVRAMARLAHDTFGDCGFVQLSPEMPGLFLMGYFNDRKPARQIPGRSLNVQRDTTIVFMGATYADLHAQVKASKGGIAS